MPADKVHVAKPETKMSRERGLVVAPLFSDPFVVNRDALAVQSYPNNPYYYLTQDLTSDDANVLHVPNPNGLPFFKPFLRFKGATPTTSCQALVYGVTRWPGRGGGSPHGVNAFRQPADVDPANWPPVSELLSSYHCVPLRDPRDGTLICDFADTVEIAQDLGETSDSSSQGDIDDNPDPNFGEQWPDAYYYTHGLDVLLLVSQAAEGPDLALILGHFFA